MELGTADQRMQCLEISLSEHSFEVLNLKESREELIKGECGFNEDIIFCSRNTCA